MESWRLVWRKAAPLLSTESLEALREALVNDDPRLLQGATTTPPPLQCVQEWPVEAACLFGYCGTMRHGGFEKHADGTPNNGAATVAQVEEFFARMCFDIDAAMGEAGGCRWLLNYWDEEPREKVFREVLEEVNRSLAQRLSLETDSATSDHVVTGTNSDG